MHVDATVSEPFSGLSGRLIDIMASVNAGGGFGSVDHLVQTARNRVAGADSASITSYRRGRFTTTVASDDLSRRGDSLQYELGSGPCVDAVVNGTVYGSGDVAVDDRWPEWGRRVSVELGVSSMLCFHLHTGSSESLDGLNIYSRTMGAFDDDAVLTGLFIATQVALAMSRDKVANFEVALSTSREIGTAIGVLMTGAKLTRDQAFGQLRVASQETNRRLRDVAAEVVDTGMLQLHEPPRSRGSTRPAVPVRPVVPVRPAGPVRPPRSVRAARAALPELPDLPDLPERPDRPDPEGRVA